MATSWTVGVLALMAGEETVEEGGRDAVLPILCHGDEVKVVVGDF
jgi:hypothetical protein